MRPFHQPARRRRRHAGPTEGLVPRDVPTPAWRLICSAKMHRALQPRRLAVAEEARARLSRRCEAGRIRVSSCQFQALFNSLFKVLCIFPSRYLFAIGLPPVFSFRWNLPPASGCTPKQPDSTRAHRTIPRRRMTGFSPSPIPRSKGFWRRGGPMAPLQTTIQEAAREWPPDFRRELCPLHSPLLGASLLVSFPPLSDMLKFSG